MIPHHRGAVRMSENALRFPLCPELVPLLDAIIVSQKEGIRKMQCLMKRAGSSAISFITENIRPLFEDYE